MSEDEKRRTGLPRCPHRRYRDGIPFCYAIGCFALGDMPCECETCDREPGVKPSFCCRKLQQEKG